LRETRYGERERLAPQDLSSRDRRRGHRRAFDVGAGRISVDLQEYRTALLVGDDDPFHVVSNVTPPAIKARPHRMASMLPGLMPAFEAVAAGAGVDRVLAIIGPGTTGSATADEDGEAAGRAEGDDGRTAAAGAVEAVGRTGATGAMQFVDG
jgi:hypothetical protein